MPVTQILSSYEHIQDVASDTWTINHGLNLLYPIVDVWVDVGGTLTKIMPLSVEVVDGSSVTVSFSSAREGKALVV